MVQTMKPTQSRYRPTLFLSTVIVVTSLLTGCDGKNSFSAYSNYDLKGAHAICKSKDLSPSGAQRCRNIEKECNNRKEDSGFRC